MLMKDMSVLWSLLHTLVMFCTLFESRFSRKKTVVLTCSAMIPLILMNFAAFILVGAERYIQHMLLICTLPSLVFFWFLAKNRNGRFLFTFCLVDTVVLEIIYLTMILDFLIPGDSHLVMILIRFAIFPLLEWLILSKIRPVYLEIQKNIVNGWYFFTAIGVIFYVAMTISVSYPCIITERPQEIPAFVLFAMLMPLLYVEILMTLSNLQRVHEMRSRESILRLQMHNLTDRIDEFSAADAKFRIERHDFRHKMQMIAGLAEKGQCDQIRLIVKEYSDAVRKTEVRRYCAYPIVDAALSSYLQKASVEDIDVRTELAFPEKLTVNEAELATVFANAIENAINACVKLEPRQRRLEVRVRTDPRFMIQISNSYDGVVTFGKDGVPVREHEDHGFGTRSIVAFCEKYGGFYEFKADGNRFSLRIVF